MALRLLHYSDIENAYDDPERLGRLAGTVDRLRDDDALDVQYEVPAAYAREVGIDPSIEGRVRAA